MTPELVKQASKNIQDILQHSLKIDPDHNVVVIYDTDYDLTKILTEGYKIALENLSQKANFYDFNEMIIYGKDEIIKLFNNCKPYDLVVLIQSGSFRLDDFRIRLHLFSKKLKVVEHLHLHRNKPDVFDVYINSLKYDQEEQNWYQKKAQQLVNQLPAATKLEFTYSDSSLTTGKLEIPKLNIGDYSNMENIGGTFPIGEVFTESKDFESMNGSIYIYGFADRSFNISFYDPFRIDIQKGLVVGYGPNTPDKFIEVLHFIKESERPLVREIGFGLNRAISKQRPLDDITAYERIVGIHLSLGEKHSVYKKTGIKTHKTKFHVDLFLCIDRVNLTIDEQKVTIMDQNGYLNI